MPAPFGKRPSLTDSERIAWAYCYSKGLRAGNEHLVSAALDAALTDRRLARMLSQIDRNVAGFLHIQQWSLSTFREQEVEIPSTLIAVHSCRAGSASCDSTNQTCPEFRFGKQETRNWPLASLPEQPYTPALQQNPATKPKPAMHGALFRHINGLQLRVWGGDLFDARTDAIVNSDQTDFQLARTEGTISNGILKRYGQVVQDELDRNVAAILAESDPSEPIPRNPLTGLPILEPGTVLKTSSGTSRTIYHAGFHHPHVWLNEDEDLNATAHVAVIQRCIRTILRDFAGSDLQSIALPLIGTGVFGLDREFIYVQTVETVTDYASRHPMPGKTVVIVRRLPKEFSAFLESAVVHSRNKPSREIREESVIFDRVEAPDEPIHYGGVQSYRLDPGTMRGAFFELGVPFLDGFATHHVLSSNDETWRTWNTVRFGEILCNLMLHKLASDDGLHPRDLFKPHTQVTFDHVRKTCAELVSTAGTKDEWGSFFAEKLDRHAGEDGILSELNQVRNSVAHGRKVPKFEHVYKLLWELVRPVEWAKILQREGPVDLYSLYPWEYKTGGNSYGLFERWNARYTLYLDPVAGEDFEKRTAPKKRSA